MVNVKKIRSKILYSDLFFDVSSCLRKLERDEAYSDLLFKNIESKIIDTRVLIYYLAKVLQPKVYVEIGVRRGWSMACAIAASGNCKFYGFDMWASEEYAGAKNPGKDFVYSEMRKIKECDLHLIQGDSHETVKKYLKENNIVPSLALVDGDHSLEGALQDLQDVYDCCENGSVIVFDDLITHPALIRIWNLFMKNNKIKNHVEIKNGPGMGVCVVKK